MKGYVHSLQSLGTLDGPGLRAVVFSSGCPLRCIYCHNPDTHVMKNGEETDHEELVGRILRLRPYIKDGGVTFSGGEPCLQAGFFTEVAKALKGEGLHIALDTSGAVINDDVDRLLEFTDLVLLDVKFVTEDEYVRYTGGHLSGAMTMLEKCQKKNLPVWIRQVIVPGINDDPDKIRKLSEICKQYNVIKKIELLPFKKLCLEKYESLGIPFTLKDTPETSDERIRELEEYLKN